MGTPSWENVLLLQTSFLGDTVLTLPLIDEIRRQFPVKKLTLLCQPASRELLRDHPAIDEIVVDDKKNADRGFAGLRAKARALKAQNFTVALTPHKSLRSAVMLYWADIPCRVGFRQSKGWFLFNRRVDRDAIRHDVERNLSILSAFGLRVEDCRREIDLPVSAILQEAVDRKLSALGVAQGDLVVGVCPGSVWPTKRWSITGFAELIRMLRKRIACTILLFGGPEDAPIVQQVHSQSGGFAINLVDHIGLRELPAAISRCALFITNDSGPMHVAVARKIPTLAIFCATTPELGFFPYTDKAMVVGKNLSCRPCGTHGGRRCPLGHAHCIEKIETQTVLEATEKLLSSVERMNRRPESFQPEFLTV
ncbi:MAG TPA: lipopolysaccharide heptosyltransferase II [Candidatus Binatia bacterium]